MANEACVTRSSELSAAGQAEVIADWNGELLAESGICHYMAVYNSGGSGKLSERAKRKLIKALWRQIEIK